MRLRPSLLAGGLLLLAACQDRTTAPAPQPQADAELARADAAGRQSDRARVIIRLQSRADQDEVGRRAEEAGGRVLRTMRRSPMLVVEVNRNALEGLRRSPRVVSIIEDIPDRPTLDQSIPVINADDVHDLGWNGFGHTVVVLDNGIDNAHPFYTGRVVAEACFSTAGTNEVGLCPNGTATQTGAGSASNEVANCLDGTSNLCDHGAHVAGIAAGDGFGIAGAPATGVAPEANIIGIQVFVRNNSMSDCSPRTAPCTLSYPSDQIAALEHVLDDLSGTWDIAAVNMSLGGGEFSSACDSDGDSNGRKAPIDNLLAAGIATVVSAGNSGFAAAVGRPACISTAITVGATEDDDDIAGFSNRGVLLDLFAPGDGITSSVDADGYGGKNGTSMAAPHVAGAFAVLRHAYPSKTVAEILSLLQTSGVAINYTSGGSSVTTRRIDLAAALAAGSQAPVLSVTNAAVTANEGSQATNGGTATDPEGQAVTVTASVGAISQDGANWTWSYTPPDGPGSSATVTITATDDKGATATKTFQLTVNNVVPSVAIAAGQVKTSLEGTTRAISATFSDPGVLDAPFTASVTCWNVAGFGSSVVAGTVTVTENAPPNATGTVSAQCPYGDRSTGTGFAVTVEVTDKDGGRGSASFDMVVTNVKPTAAIDLSGATVINGVPTVIGQIGQPIAFAGGATDPGSDDLRLTWDWADDETTVTTFLNAGPGADPLPSPSTNPRTVSDPQSHTWATACLFTIALTALDDDGGSDADEASVVMIGNSGRARGSGYWQPQYRNGRTSELGMATLQCYLDIAGHMSAVFSEARQAATFAQAGSVLQPKNSNGSMTIELDQQLLAAWLNFANGAYGWTQLVDTNRDGVPDTPFNTAVAAAEAVRLNPGATRAQLETQMRRLESINLMHGG